MSERYWLPHEIIFTREQVEWVLDNIHTLSCGSWPGTIPSGYTELPSIGRVNPRAYFETAILVAVEVELRIRKCGLDGYLVEEKYMDGLSEEDIAQTRSLLVGDVRRRINRVLFYCASGRNQRTESYEDWRRKVKHQRKIRGQKIFS